MFPDSSQSWNQVIYLVSDVYSITGKFPLSCPKHLETRIRRAAVSLSSVMNALPEVEIYCVMDEQLYNILGTIALLETYVILAKNQCMGVNLDGIDKKLQDLKERVRGLIRSNRPSSDGNSTDGR
jgi:hypothetical protein